MKIIGHLPGNFHEKIHFLLCIRDKKRVSNTGNCPKLIWVQGLMHGCSSWGMFSNYPIRKWISWDRHFMNTIFTLLFVWP